MEKTIEKGKKYLLNTYKQANLVITKGEGSYLYDQEGKQYLDFLSGIAVNSLGHQHPNLEKEIKDQLKKILHCSNLFWNEEQVKLAEKLVQASHFQKAFFCNSGAEANEAMIKLARKYKKDRFEIISLKKSFHGRTLGALAATGQKKYQTSFKPLPEGFQYVEKNNFQELEGAVTEKTGAILLELVQGEGGVYPLEKDYVRKIGDLCQKRDILLLIDEVQTGIGRTGRRFCYEHYSLEPDLISLAKGLAGGVPIGAILANEKLADVFQPGDHASTFGGNPLATRAANAVLELVFEEDFLLEVEAKGEFFKKHLEKLQSKYDFLGEVRGLGLILGLDSSLDAFKIVEKALDKGLIINATSQKTLRFLPALTISFEEIKEGLEILDEVFLIFSKEQGYGE